MLTLCAKSGLRMQGALMKGNREESHVTRTHIRAAGSHGRAIPNRASADLCTGKFSDTSMED